MIRVIDQQGNLYGIHYPSDWELDDDDHKQPLLYGTSDLYEPSPFDKPNYQPILWNCVKFPNGITLGTTLVISKDNKFDPIVAFIRLTSSNESKVEWTEKLQPPFASPYAGTPNTLLTMVTGSTVFNRTGQKLVGHETYEQEVTFLEENYKDTL